MKSWRGGGVVVA